MKRIAVLGCTGSIGTQTLDIVRRYPDKFIIDALVANTDVVNLKKYAEEFRPRFVGICDENSAKGFSLSYKAEVVVGKQALVLASSLDSVNIVVCAVVGMAGLDGVMSAINSGKTVALANKESLVCSGEIMIEAAKRNNVTILPVDSEHSAVFQCLHCGKKRDVDSIILTASGGPFRDYKSLSDFDKVTVAMAIAHPNWKMGKKISVDSATMMNKGLEIIEARWLFDCKNIDYIIHPQSIIHSMVKFKDGAIIAQMSNPTMELPIQLALTYPDRLETETDIFDFDKDLTFRKPNEELFFLPMLAKQSLIDGKSAPCVLNSANEKAVELFLTGKIGFSHIQQLVRRVYESSDFIKLYSVSDVNAIHLQTMERTEKDYKKLLRL